MMGIGMAVRPPRQSLTHQALAAIRRAGGTVFLSGLPRNYFDSAGTTPATVDNPVGLVKDSVGSNNATQPTTGSKPTLRRDAAGRYSWQFDPAAPGDFLQTAITTGNEGWVCAGVNFADANVTFFSSGTTAANAGVWLYRNVGGAKSMNLAVANGSAIAYSPNVTPSSNTPVVVSGGWTATTVFAGVDNTESSTTARGGPSASTLPLRIGMATDGSYMLSGGMTVAVICPTLPPPADRALIRKWVGSLQGQTL